MENYFLIKNIYLSLLMTLQRMRAQRTTLTSFAHNLARQKHWIFLLDQISPSVLSTRTKKTFCCFPCFELLMHEYAMSFFFFGQFKQMDKDQTGTIDWWEFLNHEALKRIGANRSKVRIFFFLIFWAINWQNCFPWNISEFALYKFAP